MLQRLGSKAGSARFEVSLGHQEAVVLASSWHKGAQPGGRGVESHEQREHGQRETASCSSIGTAALEQLLRGSDCHN